MTTKSPTLSIRSRESIGADTFNKRREVFNQNDSVFLPASPIRDTPVKEVQLVTTSNRGRAISNFQRNAPKYSSMRETRKEDISENVEFRQRKLSDNITSTLNQSDEVDYRLSMTERTRRLSRLRREFLASNLHDPSSDSFIRGGTRASLPATKVTANYKIESPKLYKFPFADPFTTPTPTRRIVINNSKDEDETQSSAETKHQSLPIDDNKEMDHRKLFEELVNRYSPLRKDIDWTLPPTKPKIVGTLPKQDKTVIQNNSQDVTDIVNTNTPGVGKTEVISVENHDSQLSLTEINEKNDKVPELTPIQRRLSRESTRKHIQTDVTIPALLEKINADAEVESIKNKQPKKIKRKRSFLDKLLNRNKKS